LKRRKTSDGKGFNYLFQVKDHNVILTITKLDDTKTSIWKREWFCDCKAGIRTNKEMCSHTMACFGWLLENIEKVEKGVYDE